jgi:hypothetical protein
MARLITALLALALLAPAGAAAQSPQTNAPPGNSAIDEYLETVPTAGGDATPRPPGAATGGEQVLTQAQRAALERQGPDGKALADVVDATAPSRGAVKGTHAQAEPVASGSHDSGRSPLTSTVSAAFGADDGRGLGVGLPLILLSSLLGVIALAVLRRRRGIV